MKHTDKPTTKASAPETRHQFEQSEILSQGASHPVCSICGLSRIAITHELCNQVKVEPRTIPADEIDGQPLVTHSELVRRMCDEGDPRHDSQRTIPAEKPTAEGK